MEKAIRNIIRHSEWSEKEIEKYLCKEVVQREGISLKYSNPNMTGYPDRLIILPGKPAAWAEIKSHGKEPTKLQNMRIEQLRELGQRVAVLTSKPEVDDFLKELSR